MSTDWQERALQLRALLVEAQALVEHDRVCDVFVRPRVGCNCGVDVWHGMVKNVLAATPERTVADDGAEVTDD